MSLVLAPSAPPTSFNVTNITTASITVQWGPVDCIQSNGDITGYSVRYRPYQQRNFPQQIVNVGPATSKLTISKLMDFTTYSIKVAAVNRINIGVYTDPLLTTTKRKLLKIIKTLNYFLLYSSGIS